MKTEIYLSKIIILKDSPEFHYKHSITSIEFELIISSLYLIQISHVLVDQTH